MSLTQRSSEQIPNTRINQRIIRKQNLGVSCSKFSRRNSITDSENSLSSHQESPSILSSSLSSDKKFTYWSIQRSRKKLDITLYLLLSILDIGSLDPGLYLMSGVTNDKEFKVNIALKYSIIEDVLSIIIFKCTFKVNFRSFIFM